MPKSILFVMPSLSAGGTENYVLRLLKHAGSEDFCWHLLSLDPVRGDLHDAFESVAATIHYQSIGYGNPQKLIQLYRLIKKLEIVTISTFTGNFGGLALTVARIAGVKKRIGWYRATEPAYKPSFFRTNYDRFANFLLWKNATQILSNSTSALHRHQPTLNRKCPVRVIDNGVDASLFHTEHLSRNQAKRILNISTGKFTVCHVGRVDPAKNHQTIFKTIQEVRVRQPNVVFLFCGKGTDSRDFLESLHNCGIADIAIGLGLRSDLTHVYAASDLFYFPSITEGQPNALIEAMLCEVPILASNISPIQEVLPQEHHDLLIDPLDWKMAADAIISIARGEKKLPCQYRHYALHRFDSPRAFNAFLNLL